MKHKNIFWGKVIEGKKRGRVMGFPTANLRLHKAFSEGIYVSQVKLSGKLYNALTFIGGAKTFGENDYKAEIYILNFDKNIYIKRVSVRLLKKIRDNEKFASKEKLIKQMEQDKKTAIEYFKNYV